MKNFVLALALGCVGALLLADVGRTEERPVPLRLGFLDVRQVFAAYGKRREVEADLKRRTDALAVLFERRDAEIHDAEHRLEALSQDGEERRSLDRQIRLDRCALEIDRATQQRVLQAEARATEAALYAEISQAAKACADERGLAAVFLFSPLAPGFETKSDLDVFMGTRTVLAHDASLDVTADVIARLNAEPARPARGAAK